MRRISMALVALTLMTSSDAALGAGDLYVAMPDGARWDQAHAHLVRVDPRGPVEISPGGELTTPVLAAAGKFDRAVPHWTAETADGAEMDIEARVFRGGEPLSGWYKLSTWS